MGFMKKVNGGHAEVVMVGGTDSKTMQLMKGVQVTDYGITDEWIDTDGFGSVSVSIIREGAGDISSNIVWSHDKDGTIFDYVGNGDVNSLCANKPVIARYFKISVGANAKMTVWVHMLGAK